MMKKLVLFLTVILCWNSFAQKNANVTTATPPPPGIYLLYGIDPDNDGYTSFNISGYISRLRISMLNGFAHLDLSGYTILAYAEQSNNTLVAINTPFYTNTILNQHASLKATYSGSGPYYSQISLDAFIQAYGGEFDLKPLAYSGNTDNDGVVNGLEDLNGNLDPLDDDTDGDGIANYGDNDDDGDGVLTINEDYNASGSPLDDDSNSNGIPDYLDFSARGSLSLNLKLFIEGYYSGGGTMRPAKHNKDGISPLTDVENITVELHAAAAPFSLIASTTAVLKTNGNAACTFPPVSVGSYYIVVKSVNGLTTWSESPQSVSNVAITYDFSNSAAKAFGSNLKNLGNGVFGLYSGDLNQDGNIDTIDFPVWQVDSNNFATGNYTTDLNGDGNVDTIDYPLWESNNNTFISTVEPQ